MEDLSGRIIKIVLGRNIRESQATRLRLKKHCKAVREIENSGLAEPICDEVELTDREEYCKIRKLT